MEIISLLSRDYCSNTYLAVSEGECVIIDPGLGTDIITSEIEKHSLTPRAILLTHGHFDHIFSLDALREKYSIPAYIHENDAEMLTDSIKNAYSFFFGDSFVQHSAEMTFVDGDRIPVGKEELTVRHTPGHSKGSSCFICEDIMITGDTLFAAGIGRTDLYGGNTPEIYKNLGGMRNIPCGDRIKIYPGHGGSAVLSCALDNAIY